MPQYPSYTGTYSYPWGGTIPPTSPAQTSPWWQSQTTTTMPAMPYANPVSPNQTKPIGIYGHFVNSESEITPNEVPMDGNYAIFPTKDFRRIFVKSWNMDGTISTQEFSPVEKSEKVDGMSPDNISLAQFDKILEKLSHIEEQLS